MSGYIGNAPTAVPLTSADITDGIIVNADISSTAGITLNKLSGNPSFRNRIINGDMRIDQRNAGASTTPTVSGTYNLDRWLCGLSQLSKFSIQQNQGAVTPPAGFTNYIGVTSLSAYSTINTDQFWVGQYIEGLNSSDLNFGTANAKTVTLSFWTQSSLTGTFSGVLTNDGFNRAYPFTYTISVANTWEYKTITIVGDTSGTWLKTNGAGIRVIFSLGVGSSYQLTAGAWTGTTALGATGEVSLVGNNGATFKITGVQLEAGTSATDFEFLPIDVSLGRCKRYYHQVPTLTALDGAIMIIAYDTTQLPCGVQFPVAMRAAPTVTSFDNTGASGGIHKFGGGDFTGVDATRIATTGFTNFNRSAGSMVAGAIYVATYKADAEL